MAEKGSRTPADIDTSLDNVERIARESGIARATGLRLSDKLRQELSEKGLRGFKRGGKVKKTGVAKVHKGERVLTSKQAKKPAVKKALHARGGKGRRR